MKTIQLTIDEPILEDVDQVVTRLHTTRSTFVQEVLQIALRRLRLRAMEQCQIDAHTRQPQSADELADWLEIQDWGDKWDDAMKFADATANPPLSKLQVDFAKI